ncbi:MAG: hypothetical protein J6N56_04870 [Bacteroidales bacterium]|nr:hypothetical protein [Bacteroidales bacterium]
MTRLILFAIFTFFYSITFSQGGRYILGKNYEGYAFPKEHQIWGTPTTPNRHTLSDEEIAEAERILRSNIKKYNQTLLVGGEKIVIRYRLKKYIRQYCSYINDDGNTIVIIHLFLKKNRSSDMWREMLSDDILMVLGGSNLEGAFEVNLKTKELKRDYDLFFY